VNGSNGRDLIMIIIIVVFHIFSIEGIAESVKTGGKGVMVKLNHDGDSIDGPIFVNPDALSRQ